MPARSPGDMLDPASWIAPIEFVEALLIVSRCLAGLIELARAILKFSLAQEGTSADAAGIRVKAAKPAIDTSVGH